MILINIQNFVNENKFTEAAALAIHLGKSAQTRTLFAKSKVDNAEKYEAFEMLLLADAKEDFDIYCRYVDYRQPLARNFYLDRRKYSKEIADAVTNMYFPKVGMVSYGILRIKLPTRTGKSELFNRAAFWVQGNFPNGETLYCVGGGKLKDSIHTKREAFIDEYWDRHCDVFPNAKVEKISKGDTSVWFNKKEYADIATVTVGGSIEGFVQCSNLLVLDDLVASSEINSPNRLEEIYSSDILNAITRRIAGSPKVILIGTPITTQTGIEDPLDRYFAYRQRGDIKGKEFIIPALNENNESQISYRKFEDNETFEWQETTEKILSEQKAAYSGGNEIEIATYNTTRLMMPVDIGERRFANIKTYTEIPNSRYKDINVLDPADGGEDNAVLVHCRIYDSEPKRIYVHDIFMSKKNLDRHYNNGFLDEMVGFMMHNDIHHIHYESNLGGTMLGDTVSKICKERQWNFTFKDFKQTKNKVKRIQDNAMGVLEEVYVQDAPQSKNYIDALKELRSWTDKARHDDFTDAITKVIEIRRTDVITPNESYIPNTPLF